MGRYSQFPGFATGPKKLRKIKTTLSAVSRNRHWEIKKKNSVLNFKLMLCVSKHKAFNIISK